MNKDTGIFIAFEGIDGSGKSTQISLLKDRFEHKSRSCAVTREPSDGPVGTLLRQFLTGRIQGDEATLCALFAADRLDHLNNPVNGIQKMLSDGHDVLTDRYLLSNYAYQGVTLPIEWVMQCNAMAAHFLKPDIHLFIDVSPEAALDRMEQGRQQKELFETKERLSQVRDRYLDLIRQLKQEENIIIIDGDQAIAEISNDIWEAVSKYL